MTAPDNEPSTTLAHLTGEAFTEGISDPTRVRLSAWTPEQVRNIPLDARQNLALGPYYAMGLVACADGHFDEAELSALIAWLTERSRQRGPLGLLWPSSPLALPELRQRVCRGPQWHADLTMSIQALVSWVEVAARDPWLTSVREAAESIAGASSDSGLLAEFFTSPISDDERMSISSIEHLLAAARMAD